MAELKPCPFCGGEAAIRYQDVYMSKAVFAHCKVCKARIMERYEGKHIRQDGTYNSISLEDAEKKAVEAWNRRAGDGHVGED